MTSNEDIAAMTVQEYKSPIAQLAEVLDGRGYEVNLGKSFGGEACEILADTVPHCFHDPRFVPLHRE
jgi:hypothetical protein